MKSCEIVTLSMHFWVIIFQQKSPAEPILRYLVNLIHFFIIIISVGVFYIVYIGVNKNIFSCKTPIQWCNLKKTYIFFQISLCTFLLPSTTIIFTTKTAHWTIEFVWIIFDNEHVGLIADPGRHVVTLNMDSRWGRGYKGIDQIFKTS